MPDTVWDWVLHEHVASSLVTGHELIERFVGMLEEFGWEGRDLFHVQLAFEEAIVNAITHGNEESSEKTVEVELQINRHLTRIRIRDEGNGFAPDALPDPTDDEHLEMPHGRGVMLIRQMMDEVQYNDRGNQVIMLKHRQAEHPSDLAD